MVETDPQSIQNSVYDLEIAEYPYIFKIEQYNGIYTFIFNKPCIKIVHLQKNISEVSNLRINCE